MVYVQPQNEGLTPLTFHNRELNSLRIPASSYRITMEKLASLQPNTPYVVNRTRAPEESNLALAK